MRTVILIVGLSIADSINKFNWTDRVYTFMGFVLLFCIIIDILEFWKKWIS